MDEYTLLIAAKLKADRLKLEREQREQLHVAASQPVRIEAANARDARASRRPFSKLEWREQS